MIQALTWFCIILSLGSLVISAGEKEAECKRLHLAFSAAMAVLACIMGFILSTATK